MASLFDTIQDETKRRAVVDDSQDEESKELTEESKELTCCDTDADIKKDIALKRTKEMIKGEGTAFQDDLKPGQLMFIKGIFSR